MNSNNPESKKNSDVAPNDSSQHGEMTEPSLRSTSDTNHPLETVAGEKVDAVDTELVAFLDGELDAAATDQLESRLAKDAALRQRLHELQATWDLLDELPQHRPDESFLQSTIEMAVTRSKPLAARWHRWPLRIVAGLLVFGISTAVAFQVTRSAQNQPYMELVANLEFYENSRMYELTDIHFLELMHDRKIFGDSDSSRDALEPAPKNEEDTSGSQNSFKENQARFESLSDWKVAELNGRMLSLQKKNPEAQEKLRKMHRDLLQHPQGPQLMETLREFSQLFSEFSSTEKASFLPMTPNEKIRFIRGFLVRRAEVTIGVTGPSRLPLQDIDSVGEWNKKVIADQKAALLKLFGDRYESNGRSRRWTKEQYLKRLSDRFDRGIGFLDINNAGEEANFEALLGESEIADLQERISDESVKLLENQLDLAAKKKLAFRWGCAAEASRVRTTLTAETLRDYYDNEMSEEEKKAVDRMLPNDRRRAIFRLYRGIPVYSRSRGSRGRRN